MYPTPTQVKVKLQIENIQKAWYLASRDFPSSVSPDLVLLLGQMPPLDQKIKDFIDEQCKWMTFQFRLIAQKERFAYPQDTLLEQRAKRTIDDILDAVGMHIKMLRFRYSVIRSLDKIRSAAESFLKSPNPSDLNKIDEGLGEYNRDFHFRDVWLPKTASGGSLQGLKKERFAQVPTRVQMVAHEMWKCYADWQKWEAVNKTGVVVDPKVKRHGLTYEGERNKLGELIKQLSEIINDLQMYKMSA